MGWPETLMVTLAVILSSGVMESGSSAANVTKTIATTVGRTYRIRCRARTENAAWQLRISVSGGVLTQDVVLAAYWQYFEYDVVATGVSHDFMFSMPPGAYPVVDHLIDVDDIAVVDRTAETYSVASPWTASQIADVQFGSEPTYNRIVIAHSQVAPWVIAFDTAAMIDVYAAPLTNAPAEWHAGNYPAVVELGCQGRAWFASTPDRPSMVWYSKSGSSFDFTTGVNPDDSSSFIVSTKGALRWMQGQRVLLAGDEKK